jgi:hypothetical protein
MFQRGVDFSGDLFKQLLRFAGDFEAAARRSSCSPPLAGATIRLRP